MEEGGFGWRQSTKIGGGPVPIETTGFVYNVAFPCANLYDADTGRIAIYYSVADTYTAIAFMQVDELIDHIKNNSEVF